jgi:hypothetical protein
MHIIKYKRTFWVLSFIGAVALYPLSYYALRASGYIEYEPRGPDNAESIGADANALLFRRLPLAASLVDLVYDPLIKWEYGIHKEAIY